MYSATTLTQIPLPSHTPCMEREYGARLMLRRPFSAAAARAALTEFVATGAMGIRGGGAIIRRTWDGEVGWGGGATAVREGGTIVG